jgi:hypothetical protein
MEARTLSVLRRRVGAVKGARNSGGGPVAGGRTTPSALPIAPLPRVISQRHAFVCSSLKIFCGSVLGAAWDCNSKPRIGRHRHTPRLARLVVETPRPPRK